MSAARPKIVVIGSINMDLVVRAPRLPDAGETILGGPFETHPGGKGANQAVAAARLGGDVSFVGRVGDDSWGESLRDGLARVGIDISHLHISQNESSGVALITVDDRGENTIVVAPGANARVSRDDVDAAIDTIREADVILMQLETPVETIEHVIARSEEFGATAILNAAPAERLGGELLRPLDVLIVNEHEARIMTGARRDQGGGELISILGPLVGGQTITIMTRGEAGSLACVMNDHISEYPAFEADAVDSVAAGDAFCGALAVALAPHGADVSDDDLKDAIRFASAAGAIACTRRGARPSLPTRAEVASFLRDRS